MDVEEITPSDTNCSIFNGGGTYHADVICKIYSNERTQGLYKKLYQIVLAKIKLQILQQLWMQYVLFVGDRFTQTIFFNK